MPKGDALAVARIAGIQGAKRTPDLVPLCHPIAMHGVDVDLAVADDAVHISATVRTADRTGVEMEALTCVAVAGLALVDMVKAVDRAATITDVRVEHKSGGRSGDWRREPGPPAEALGGVMRALVVTVSNRAAAGVYEDRGGPVLVEGLRGLGFEVDGPEVVPDGEPVEEALREAVASAYDVVLTTGGTGITPPDLTPEMTARVLDREVPGIAEAIRAHGAAKGCRPPPCRAGWPAWRGRHWWSTCPGRTGGVRDGLAVLGPLLGHAVDQMHGGDH